MTTHSRSAEKETAEEWDYEYKIPAEEEKRFEHPGDRQSSQEGADDQQRQTAQGDALIGLVLCSVMEWRHG